MLYIIYMSVLLMMPIQKPINPRVKYSIAEHSTLG